MERGDGRVEGEKTAIGDLSGECDGEQKYSSMKCDC